MRGLKQTSTAIGIFLLLGAQAHITELAPANFSGTGRSCFGTLSIQSKTISWTTPFSQCNALPYELLEQDSSGDRIRYTFRFTRTARACHYSILSLTHDKAQSAGLGWEVTGYDLKQSYLTDKANNYQDNLTGMMSCYLVRNQDKEKKTSDNRTPQVQ